MEHFSKVGYDVPDDTVACNFKALDFVLRREAEILGLSDNIRQACASQSSVNHQNQDLSWCGPHVPDDTVTCNFKALDFVLRRER